MGHVHICYFSALDDLPRSQWGDRVAALRALWEIGRFSTFEPVGKLATTITWILKDSGWIERTWGDYPWTYVELSKAGLAVVVETEPKP